MLNIQIKDIRVLNGILGFWGSIFSNFYRTSFVYESMTFPTSEHAFMWKKADFFKDEESKNLILKAYTPKEAKALGRKVKNFDDVVWKEVNYQFMVDILFAKFSQSKTLKDSLLSTEDLLLAELSPYDYYWGAGCHWSNASSYDKEKWVGFNYLGKALMEVRSKLKE